MEELTLIGNLGSDPDVRYTHGGEKPEKGRGKKPWKLTKPPLCKMFALFVVHPVQGKPLLCRKLCAKVTLLLTWTLLCQR